MTELNGKTQQLAIRELFCLRELMKTRYPSRSLLREVLPLPETEFAGFSRQTLASLHQFLAENKMYFERQSVMLLDTPAVIYEGDSTTFWLESKKHDSSYQPFYATWMISAAFLARYARDLGFTQVVDIGSGDGRLAHAASVLGIDSFGIEIDPHLANIQKDMMEKTGIGFHSINADATQFDYSSIQLTRPMFFISALPESGEILADAIIPRVVRGMRLAKCGVCFMGSDSMRPMSRDHSMWGWGSILAKHGLSWLDTVALPTQWTLDEAAGTPYVFTLMTLS